MLPLSCQIPPTDFDTTIAAFYATLRERVTGDALESRITVQQGTWPIFDDVTVDLTGATLKPERPVPVDLANLEAAFSIRRLAIHGEPLTVNSAKIQIRSLSEHLQLSFARDEQQRVVVVPTNVVHGETAVEITHNDLQTLLLHGAREAAKAHDAKIEDATLDLQQQSDNAARFSTTIHARKSMFQATLKIFGKIEIDKHLTLRIDDLNCEGEGMLGGMLATLVRPTLSKHNATTVPLADHSLGEVRIEHLQFDVNHGVSVLARFAGQDA